MSVEEMNLENLQRKLCERIRVFFAQDSLKCQKQKNYGWYLNRRKIQLFSD